MKTAALALILALGAASSAQAEGTACADNQTVGVSKLVAPVVDADNRLAGYAFVTPRVCLARGYSALDFREDEQFLVDALVRAVQHNPFRLEPDGSVDRTGAEAAFREALARIYLPQDVNAIALEGDDLRLIRH